MTQGKPKIRLYVPGDYAPGGMLLLGKNQSHYLSSVMRCAAGDSVSVFNGTDGEWLAEISGGDKKSVSLLLKSQRLPQRSSPDLWLVCAPIKNKTDLVVEKAVELGVSKIIIVFSRHSIVKSVNMEKLEAHVIEAAEQCERCDIPVIETARDIPTLLGSWPQSRTLLYGDESGGGKPLGELLGELSKRPLPTPLPRAGEGSAEGAGEGPSFAVLIGPEGGFAADEHRALKSVSCVMPFGMGPRILRADTAAVAALACVQSTLGDWEHAPHFNAEPQ